MKLYYDTKPVYPYICLANTDEQEVRNLISFLKTKNIIVTKFYEDPKYPASNGIQYDFLLRVSDNDSNKKSKPSNDLINSIYKDFLEKKEKNNKSKEKVEYLEKEKKYFKQIRTFLNSERKIFELDRKYFSEQLQSLNEIIYNLKKENNKVFKFIDGYDNKINSQLESLINNKTFDNNEISLLKEKLEEREKKIKKRELDLKRKESELEKDKTKIKNYRNNLELEKQEFIKQVRDNFYGVESENEDSIQDIKILVFGNSSLNSNEIYDLFNQTFIKVFGEELNKNCLDAKYLDYKSIKNSNINRKIKQDKYDYIIVGQHDHSTKGKNAKHSYKKFIEDNNLKVFVNEDYKNPLNKERLNEVSNLIINNWEQQFEIID